MAFLTHLGRVTHICVSKLTIIGSDNGLSPGRHQAIIWTNAGILSIGPLETNFSENLIGIQTFSFKKMPLKMSSAKWRPFCLGLNVFRSFDPIWWLYQIRMPILIIEIKNANQKVLFGKLSDFFDHEMKFHDYKTYTCNVMIQGFFYIVINFYTYVDIRRQFRTLLYDDFTAANRYRHG